MPIYEGFDIAGRTALVTGGTSGLGRAIALGMARAGARVFVGSRDAAKVSDTAAELAAIGPDHRALTLDVGEASSIENAFSQIMSDAGELDILVNAAGITHREAAITVSLENWERIIKVNLTGTFLCSQAAARIMKDQTGGGAIVNIASIGSFVGLNDVPAYGASKGAVMQLTSALGTDWAPYNIRVNAIAPGVFPTTLNRKFIDGTARGRWFLNHTPMRRFGEHEELVGAAIYLCSPAASFVTGETLVVDGGFLSVGVPAVVPE